MNTNRSQELFKEALSLLPGGVDSPVRAFKAVGGHPLFIDRAEGAYVYDVDGNRFLDYVLSWGPLILGHAAPVVVEALSEAISKGTSYGAPSPLEVGLARIVRELVPSIEMVRFVNSGTEATMSALRLARAHTEREKVIKFEGCYHGHVDALLAKAGSGVATLGLPDSPGVPASTAGQTVVVPYNDLGAVERQFEKFPDEIAVVIVEPVAGNMGVVPPAEKFLQGLREVTRTNGALLIFDEVMTGFRAHLRGAQTLYKVKPDLTTLGKVIGGGLPVGAYGGSQELMEMMAPAGPVYQAGTLSGNPLAMAAGIATLGEIQKAGVWEQLETAATRASEAIGEAAKKAGVPVQQNRVGTMFSTFFTDAPVTNWESASRSDTSRYGAFFRAMLENGVYLAPSQFEAGFVSTAHGEDELIRTATAAMRAFAK
jgi:glutamate-1-semialdehyde 2,1-aminomutase